MLGPRTQTYGIRFFAIKVRTGFDWKTRRHRSGYLNADSNVLVGLSEQSQRIDNAFYGAAPRHRIAPLDDHVPLFGPRLQVYFHFSDGWRTNSDPRHLRNDKYWPEYVRHLKAMEVAADYCNVVFEPSLPVPVPNVQRAPDYDQVIAGART